MCVLTVLGKFSGDERWGVIVRWTLAIEALGHLVSSWHLNFAKTGLKPIEGKYVRVVIESGIGGLY